MTEIGEGAFKSCYSLQSIEVAQDNENFMSRNNCLLSKDGTRLLIGCKTSIIPDGVIEIGRNAFSGCRDLQSIKIPGSMTEIGEGAFECCGGIQSIEVSQDNEYFMSQDNCLLSKDGARLLRGCKTSIIPGSVTEIGENAFSGCRGLQSIEIPGNVTSIGDDAFSCCRDLQSINIPDSVTSIGKNAFSYCYGLQSIELPGSVAEIGEYTFSNCISLQSIDIPNGVIKIGDFVFDLCSNLRSVKIPGSVSVISSRIFGSCLSLQSIEVSPDNEYFMSRSNCLLSKDGSILLRGCKTSVIPNSVTKIGYSAFRCGCCPQSIEIPSSVTSIEESAFLFCYGSISSLILHYDAPADLSPELVDRLPISDRITLHVPVGTGDAYRHHPVFSKAKEVVDDVR